MDLQAELGAIDIYLLDQLLRGLVPSHAAVLDAGVGRGRNLHYFLRHGHEVHAIDNDPDAVDIIEEHARATGQPTGSEHFRTEAIEDLSFPDAKFDLVICNAVLHFAKDQAHFDAMVDQLYRVLKPGGTCFCRLTSNIGIEQLVQPIAGAQIPGWFVQPDAAERFLVDLAFLQDTTQRIGAELVDPIKTVNVQNLRCMTNWVWRR
ncbi:MAG: class I SAM-dependent methyltransferase [Planctomycetota bacterium]